GEAAVEEIVKKRMVKDFADIYFLEKKDLLKLPLFKDKKADNLLMAIDKSKNRPLNRLLYGLGIRHIGEKAAYILAERFGSLDKIMSAKVNDFSSIYEIGDVMAESIVEFLKQVKVKHLIDKLNKAGLNTKQPRQQVRNSVLKDKVFVFTGELKGFTRMRAEEVVRQLGGMAASSVSKNTDFVVIGDSPGSKFRRAQALNVKVIDEEEFKKLIGEK
ncbi:MAG: helix-hairpin-helix domain-containing protein, partial [Candidatus Omnitrophica bacterium]|nr:helix-hairpin-helix domain-containing protein [Candidatus Omnitrophota bacterium]